MVSSLWHLNLSDLFAGRSLSKEVWEIRVMPASHQELRVWQNATDLASRTRVRRNPSFPYEEIYGLTCQMPDAKSGSVDPEQRRRRQRAPRLETHILIAQRLKYMSPSACFSPCKVPRIKAAGQFDRRASLIGKSKNGAQGLSSEVRGPTSPAFHPSLQNQNRSHPIHGLRPLFNRQVRLSQQPIRFG